MKLPCPTKTQNPLGPTAHGRMPHGLRGRKDIVEIQLGMSDDFMETTLLLLGSLDDLNAPKQS